MARADAFVHEITPKLRRTATAEQGPAPACRAVVVLQARARRALAIKSDVRARFVSKTLSLSETLAAKTTSLEDLGAENLALSKTVATNTISLSEGFRVIRNKDAFPGSDAFVCEVDLTKPFDCFKICRTGSYGGFSTFGGKAFFRSQSPDECYVQVRVLVSFETCEKRSFPRSI